MSTLAVMQRRQREFNLAVPREARQPPVWVGTRASRGKDAGSPTVAGGGPGAGGAPPRTPPAPPPVGRLPFLNPQRIPGGPEPLAWSALPACLQLPGICTQILSPSAFSALGLALAAL